MKIEGKFDQTSFKFRNNQFPEILEKYMNEGELYNRPDLLFLEEKYISGTDYFSNIIDKFKIKKFDGNLKIYIDDQLKTLEDFSKDVSFYGQIIEENNINNLNKKDLMVSVKHFEEYKFCSKVKYVQEIYILLFLANVTEYKENQFLFKVKSDENEARKELSFDSIEQIDLVSFYDWITASKENLRTRLKIIREIILRKNSFELVDSDLESAKSAFNRIIKEETDKYFTQVNMLKDDFLKLSERKQESYKSLHLKFLGWISTIGLFIYGELRSRPSGNLFHDLFFVTNEKTRLFLIIFILSLFIIWLIFVKEMKDNQKEYRKIEEFYTKQLFFEEKDLSNYISCPNITNPYKIMFVFFVICLIIRLFI